MEEIHDTSRNILIAIIIIVIIAIVGYFIYNATLDNEEEAIPNDTNDNIVEEEFDEIGTYSGMETYGEEEATGTVELELETDGTATLVLVYNDTNEYKGTYTKNGDNITFTANSNESAATESLTEEALDGDEEIIEDGDIDNNTNDDIDTEDNSNKTFEFKIKNNTLVYLSAETGSEVMLTKVDKNTLEYIK